MWWLFLIPFLPFFGFLLNGILHKKMPKTLVSFIACGSVFLSFLLSLYAFYLLHQNQSTAGRGSALESTWFQWIKAGSYTIDFALYVDALTVVMLLVVTGIGFLIHLYSVGYMKEDPAYTRYFAYLNLFMASMLMLVMGKNLALLFLGWEGVGLCSYLLIGFWFKDLKNAKAGEKAFIVNRIGDLGFLVGLFLLLKYTSTLDVPTLKQNLPALANQILFQLGSFSVSLGMAICFCLFIGACGKSAQIPLYVWLPDAMAGPTAVSALIHAATMVTAGIYMICRLSFLYEPLEEIRILIGLVAVATAFFTAVIALGQNDIKKVLAYSTISQLGYMFMALAAGAFSAGIFHLVTHAFFKALLFLTAGVVIHALHGEQDIRKMGGLFKVLRLPGIVFLIGVLAISGVPPLAGFFSKDEILAAVYSQYHQESPFHSLWAVIWAGSVLTALLTAFYMTRLLTVVFFGKSRVSEDTLHHLHLPDWSMKIPLLVLALLSIVGGATGSFIHLLFPSVHSSGEGVHRFIVTLSCLACFGGMLSAWLLFSSEKSVLNVLTSTRLGSCLQKILQNKFYIDEIYYYTLVYPLHLLAGILFVLIDRLLIDTILVGGPAWLFQKIALFLHKKSSGLVNIMLVFMVLGCFGLLTYLLLWKIQYLKYL
jgi:NADH-quinone oxidoreductase subunit L